jgi:hypothetical protein
LKRLKPQSYSPGTGRKIPKIVLIFAPFMEPLASAEKHIKAQNTTNPQVSAIGLSADSLRKTRTAAIQQKHAEKDSSVNDLASGFRHLKH